MKIQHKRDRFFKGQIRQTMKIGKLREYFAKLSNEEQTAVRLRYGDDLIQWYFDAIKKDAQNDSVEFIKRRGQHNGAVD